MVQIKLKCNSWRDPGGGYQVSTAPAARAAPGSERHSVASTRDAACGRFLGDVLVGRRSARSAGDRRGEVEPGADMSGLNRIRYWDQLRRGRLPRQAMDAPRRGGVVSRAVGRDRNRPGTGTGNCHFFSPRHYQTSNVPPIISTSSPSCLPRLAKMSHDFTSEEVARTWARPSHECLCAMGSSRNMRHCWVRAKDFSH
jgi:hypothetical protein